MGRISRAEFVRSRMAELGLRLGPRAQGILADISGGVPPKGPWQKAPGLRRRIGNQNGPGATYRLASQAEGAQAIIAFSDPDLNRNSVYTNVFVYDRLSTPVTEDLETRIVRFVGGNLDRIEAVALATGQSANVLCSKMFAYVGVAPELEARRAAEGVPLPQELLRRGRHGVMIPGKGLYGCSFDHLRELAEYEGRDVHTVNLSDLGAVRETLKNNPHIKLIFCEALNNPNVTLLDIQALARLRNEINREKGYEGDDKIKLVVDLTFTTTQIRPYEWDEELWPDAVTISATKLLAGGSHMGGFVIAPRENIAGKRGALYLRKDTGGVMSDPVAKGLLKHGLPTVLQRSALTQHNASEFAKTFAGDDRVTVYYPGLTSHPQHDIALRLMRDHDGGPAFSHMVRIHLNPPPGAPESVIETITRKVIDEITSPSRRSDRANRGLYYAVSLGNDEGLLSQSVSTTQAVMELIHSQVLPDRLEVTFADLRLSIGFKVDWQRTAEQFRYALDAAFKNCLS